MRSLLLCINIYIITTAVCDQYEREGNYRLMEDKMLENPGNVLMAESLGLCVIQCFQQGSSCFSINYNRGEKLCQTNLFYGTTLVSAEGWIHAALQACYTNPCVSGTCKESETEATYHCVCDGGYTGTNCDTAGVSISTPDLYLYDPFYPTGRRTDLTFTVKANNDAHMALSAQESSNTNTYEIVIGGWSNGKSCIRTVPQSTCQTNPSTPSILNSGEDRPFWLSWNQGIIQFGTGTIVGENKVMEYTHSIPYDVKYFSVSTGWGNSGEWNFY